jgi:hypothetical protein
MMMMMMIVMSFSLLLQRVHAIPGSICARGAEPVGNHPADKQSSAGWQ